MQQRKIHKILLFEVYEGDNRD